MAGHVPMDYSIVQRERRRYVSTDHHKRRRRLRYRERVERRVGVSPSPSPPPPPRSPPPPPPPKEKRRKRRKSRHRSKHRYTVINWSPSWSPEEPSKIEGEESFAVEVLDRRDEGDFGWLRWRPSCFQCCQNPWCFLMCLCLLVIGHHFGGNGVLPASVVQLERRFNVHNAEVALFRSSYDIGFVASMVPFVINVAYGSHRPKWIAIGGLVSSVGAVICTLPHFLSGPATPPALRTAHCASSAPTVPCIKNDPHPLHIFIFASGFLLMGIGAAPVSVLGITYLDESVPHTTSAVFTGFYAVADLLGPTLGIITTSWLIQVNGDLDRAGNFKQGNQRDPHWYGAWWLSMYIAAAMSFIGSMWMFGFPEKIRGSMEAHISDARRAVLPRRRRNDRKGTKEIPQQLSPWRLAKIEEQEKFQAIMAVLKSVTFWCLVLEQCTRRLLSGGLVLFLPKYMATVFDASPADADFFMGALICGSAICGLAFGTVFQRGFELKAVGNLRLSVVATVGSLVCSMTFLVACRPLNIAGVTRPYPGESNMIRGLNASCNRNCSCSTDIFAPVCFYSGNKRGVSIPINYYSSCYAGCKYRQEQNGSDCTCFDVNGENGTATAQSAKHIPGAQCLRCSPFKLAAFLVGDGWFALFAYFRMNPVQQAILRVVPFHSRLVALALSSAAGRLVGTVPGAFSVAATIRSSCLIWKTACNEKTVCALYDRAGLAYRLTGLTAGSSVVALLALIVALVLYKSSPPATSQSSDTASSATPSSDKAEERMTWLT